MQVSLNCKRAFNEGRMWNFPPVTCYIMRVQYSNSLHDTHFGRHCLYFTLLVAIFWMIIIILTFVRKSNYTKFRKQALSFSSQAGNKFHSSSWHAAQRTNNYSESMELQYLSLGFGGLLLSIWLKICNILICRSTIWFRAYYCMLIEHFLSQKLMVPKPLLTRFYHDETDCNTSSFLYNIFHAIQSMEYQKRQTPYTWDMTWVLFHTTHKNKSPCSVL